MTMSSSNSFPGPDFATLLSIIQGGASSNGAGHQQQQNGQSVLQSVVGSHVQSSTNGVDPSIMSSLLQGLAGALSQQHQSQPRSGAPDLMSLFTAQQYGQMGGGGQGLDLARLAASGLFGNIHTASNSVPANQHSASSQQIQMFANMFNSQQASQSNHTQEQALALARLAGARLLSTAESHRSDSGRVETELTEESLNRDKESESGDASPFSMSRNNVTAVEGVDDTARGRNLEPGAIAVPCRARGMPMDHNPLTAYFVISNGIQHGNDVVCSHPACRNAGVKFRYCSFCKAPVAKRNFRRRHNHGGDTSTLESDDENTKVSTADAVTSRRLISKCEGEPEPKRAKLITSEDDNVDATTDSSKSSADNGRKSFASKSQVKKEATEASSTIEVQATTGELGSSPDTIKSSGRNLSQERRDEWAKLLDERPLTNDAESMSAWIAKILKASDPAGQASVLSHGDA